MIEENVLSNSKYESGFTRAEAVVLIGVIVFVALVLFLPALAKVKAKASRIHCPNNLKNVGLAFRIYATDNNDLFPMAISTNSGGSKEHLETGEVYRHFQAMSNELCTPKSVVCPVDAQQGRKEAISFTSGFSDATISYFVGLDAAETNERSILSGDRNLEGGKAMGKRVFAFTSQTVPRWTARIHRNSGWLCYGDGHVAKVQNDELPASFKPASNSIIRLAIPQ